MPEYIEREALIEHIKDLPTWDYIAKADGVYEKSTKYPEGKFNCDDVINSINNAPAADVVEVVRCKDCKFATELDKHCDINRTAYKHCSLWRGDETRNVWHKYKKYYKDYSIVSLDDFCSCAERRSDNG